jgi:hypothetical protein
MHVECDEKIKKQKLTAQKRLAAEALLHLGRLSFSAEGAAVVRPKTVWDRSWEGGIADQRVNWVVDWMMHVGMCE